MSHEHLFKHRFLDILELFQLTLMKGDKVVELPKECTYQLLCSVND